MIVGAFVLGFFIFFGFLSVCSVLKDILKELRLIKWNLEERKDR